MVVIFSTQKDFSTNQVMAWLQAANENVVRLNAETYESWKDSIHLTISNQNTSIALNGEQMDAIWFRKDKESNLSQAKNLPVDVINYLNSEIFAFKKGIYEVAKHTTFCLGVNNYDKFSDTNKIKNLILAASLGIEIPNTVLTNSKKDLTDFINKNEAVVTKSGV